MKKILKKEEILSAIEKGIKKYENLDLLGRYAMYMGVAQILEFGLKKLYQEKYGSTLEEIQKWTLGKTKNELSNKGLRPSFIILLESVVESRNYIAHEMLTNYVLMRSVSENLKTESYSKDIRFLDRAIYELEQIIFLFDWTNHNNAW